MADPNFEKQVQQKMEELQFAPSETVWQKVDAEINKEKKRRPILWFIFFLGLTLAGTVFYFSNNLKNTSVTADNAIVKKDLTQNKKQENIDNKKKGKSSESIASVESYSETSGKKNKNEIIKTDGFINKKNKKLIVSTFQNESKKFADKNYSVKNQNEKSVNKNQLINKNKSSSKKLLINKQEKNEDDVAENMNAEKETKDVNKKINETVDEKKENNQQIDSAKKTITTASEKSIVKDSMINKTVAQKDKKTDTTSKWKIGITGGAGFSGINTGLFKSAMVATPAAAPTNIYNPGTANISSKINNGFSFSAGFFAKKFLSKRISFSGGVTYHYYSTTIKTGSYSDTTIFVYYPTANASSPVSNSYNYGNSNSYVNHYHFVELPLLISFQMNKNKNLPINWEAGFTVSYLINTNALQFDDTKNIYYKNNSAFNKTQASAATALTIGFPVHGNILHVGPQFQYGFTQLLNKNSGNTEHLFFTGIKISTTLGKK